MDCQSVQCKVETAVEAGALPDLSADEETHIRSCAQCSTVALLVQAGLPESSAVSEATAPADLADSVMARIAAETSGPRAFVAQDNATPSRLLGFTKLLIPLAAAALLVIVLKPMLQTSPSKESAGQTDAVAMKKAASAARTETSNSVDEFKADDVAGSAIPQSETETALIAEANEVAELEPAPAPGDAPAFLSKGSGVTAEEQEGDAAPKAPAGPTVVDEPVATGSGSKSMPHPLTAKDAKPVEEVQGPADKADEIFTVNAIKAKDQTTVTASAEISITNSVQVIAPRARAKQEEVTEAAAEGSLNILDSKRRALKMEKKTEIQTPGEAGLPSQPEEQIVVVQSTVKELKKTDSLERQKTDSDAVLRKLSPSEETQTRGQPFPKSLLSDNRNTNSTQQKLLAFLQKRFPQAKTADNDGTLLLSIQLGGETGKPEPASAEDTKEKTVREERADQPLSAGPFVVTVSFLPNSENEKAPAKASKPRPAGPEPQREEAKAPDLVTIQIATGVFHLRLTNQPAGSDALLKELIELLQSYR